MFSPGETLGVNLFLSTLSFDAIKTLADCIFRAIRQIFDSPIILHIRYTDATGLSIAVIVSPLTSLMLDQQTKFAPRGLKVNFVGEQQSDPLAKQNVLQGNVQLVYITSENLIENNESDSPYAICVCT